MSKEHFKWINAAMEVDRLRGGFSVEELRTAYDDLRTLPWQPERGYEARRSFLRRLRLFFEMHDAVEAYFAKQQAAAAAEAAKVRKATKTKGRNKP